MQWNALWDLSKPVYVEKSPQSLVKIASLREIYESRGFVVKVVVVIKVLLPPASPRPHLSTYNATPSCSLQHPVTINTMTPRKYGWRYERDIVGSSLNNLRPHGPNGARPAISLKPEISPLQMEENMRHFLQTLHHRYVAQASQTKGANCSLGWLDAYEELLQYLQAEQRANEINKNVIRVVHYESFLHPIHVCQQILAFIFSSTAADPTHRVICSLRCSCIIAVILTEKVVSLCALIETMQHLVWAVGAYCRSRMGPQQSRRYDPAKSQWTPKSRRYI